MDGDSADFDGVKPLTRPPALGGARPAALLCVLFLSCVYDPGQRCGRLQVYDEGRQLCFCEQGAVPHPEGFGWCVPCGENERAEGVQCVCEPGHSRLTAKGPCVPSGLGEACDTLSNPCDDEPFTHCQATDGTAGYCTLSGCQSSTDCPATYACDTAADPTYCKRPPVGQGKACQSHSDCAGQEATFCDNLYENQCLVEGCTVGGSDCHEGWRCCDFTKFGLAKTLCVELTSCP